MKKKSWLEYFFIILLIFLMVFGGKHILDGIRINAQKTYNSNPYFQYSLISIFYVAIGLILGLDHLIKEIKKEGKWVINIPKLVLMGIPSLYLSLSIFIYYSNNQFVRNLSSYPMAILSTCINFISVFQLIFGYSIITSFYKKMSRNE